MTSEVERFFVVELGVLPHAERRVAAWKVGDVLAESGGAAPDFADYQERGKDPVPGGEGAEEGG